MGEKYHCWMTFCHNYHFGSMLLLEPGLPADSRTDNGKI